MGRERKLLRQSGSDRQKLPEVDGDGGSDPTPDGGDPEEGAGLVGLGGPFTGGSVGGDDGGGVGGVVGMDTAICKGAD